MAYVKAETQTYNNRNTIWMNAILEVYVKNTQ